MLKMIDEQNAGITLIKCMIAMQHHIVDFVEFLCCAYFCRIQQKLQKKMAKWHRNFVMAMLVAFMRASNRGKPIHVKLSYIAWGT